jgi:hypothetical protein
MSAECPHCTSSNTEPTAPGAVLDSYRCNSCLRSFACVSSGGKRIAIIGLVTLFTGGLDGGVLGSLIASFIAPSGDDGSTLF